MYVSKSSLLLFLLLMLFLFWRIGMLASCFVLHDPVDLFASWFLPKLVSYQVGLLISCFVDYLVCWQVRLLPSCFGVGLICYQIGSIPGLFCWQWNLLATWPFCQVCLLAS